MRNRGCLTTLKWQTETKRQLTAQARTKQSKKGWMDRGKNCTAVQLLPWGGKKQKKNGGLRGGYCIVNFTSELYISLLCSLDFWLKKKKIARLCDYPLRCKRKRRRTYSGSLGLSVKCITKHRRKSPGPAPAAPRAFGARWSVSHVSSPNFVLAAQKTNLLSSCLLWWIV